MACGGSSSCRCSRSTIRSRCRRSRICAAAPAWRSGPAGAACNFFQPGTLTGITPQYVQYDSGNPGYETDWNNFAPERRRGLAAERAGRLAARDRSAIRIRPRSAAATRSRSRASAWTVSPACTAPIPAPRSTPTAPATRATSCSPGETWPVTLQPAEPSRAAAVPGSPRVSAHAVARQRRRHQHLRSADQGAEHAFVEHRPPARASRTTWRSTCATSAPGCVNGWTTENWNEINIVENGFLDEFKLAQANLRAHVAAGCGTGGNPACSFAYRGAGHWHVAAADLSRVLRAACPRRAPTTPPRTAA